MPKLTTKIRKFSVKCYDDSSHQVYVNDCVRHVMKLEVMDFELCIYSGDGTAFGGLQLQEPVKLKLENGFVIDVLPKNVLLRAPDSLILDFYSLGNCVFQTLLLASPMLKELIIDGINWEIWE